MVDKSNEDSSSSEDEITKNALKEATDHQFLKNSYFLNSKSKVSDVSDKTDQQNNSIKNKDLTNPVSLRPNLEQTKQFTIFGVEPTFQHYVAKKLDVIIEKSIKFKNKETNNFINEKESEDSNYGIKLLKSSAEFLTAKEEVDEIPKPRKRKIEATMDDEANLLKCREVTVDPEVILSKEETKAWIERRKGKEFKYKRQKDGTLVEVT
ncbi:hypothetical protein WH47_04686 [Habropoda laboriosa]|uniref:Protein CUSTOS n=1 Tax=Habropoda laboriosa TaxID=597456 RepID=A0A0L7R2U2_9HYME|nr:PREDICTED: uncharacterized protein LOC108572651 [Habropoda laboriosa]KOC65096.1 hypothetical protein WH47_04686 [Habropoda laboriosa]